MALLALGYFATGWFGLLFASPPGNVSALWPPSGLALAAVLAWGVRVWPGVLLGAFATNYVFLPIEGDGVRAALAPLLVGLGSTAEILTAAALTRRLGGGRAALEAPLALLGFALAAGVGAGVGAVGGLLATLWVGGIHEGGAASFLATWFVGDWVGMLVGVPMLLGTCDKQRRGWQIEAGLVGLATLLVAQFVFGRPLGSVGGTGLPLAWMAFPPVVWAGLRLGSRMVGVLSLVLHTLVMWAALAGTGPMAVVAGEGGRLLTGLLMVTSSVTGLLLAASSAQAARVRATLEDAQRQLEAKISERTRSLEEANVALRAEVAEREKLAGRLLEAQKQEAIGRLAGGVAHDFNNLLTVIGGEAELLAHTGDAEGRDAARAILSATDRASTLTRQLLAVARRQPGEPRDVDVRATLEDLRRLLRPLLPESIAVEVDSGPDGALVHIDPVQLDQVLLNLAINARDAMPGGGRLSIRARMVPLFTKEAGELGIPPGRWVRIDVTDTGGGIPADVLPRIFEPFFTTKPGGSGTGLGLPTASGIVAQAGGVLRVASTPGEGATFSVWLPRTSPEPLTEPSEALMVPVPTGQLVVLVAEDEPLVRRLVVTALTRAGHRVLQAGDGVEALALARKHRMELDVIITDVVMPRMGGPELVRRVRDDGPIYALFISGYHEQQAELAGEAFLAKPFGVEELHSALAQLLSYTPR